MKKFVLVALMLFVGVSCLLAQENNPAKFKETKHQFGNIPQGKPATAVFEFKNTTKKPLIVEFATASCGCTKPEYPKTPILPGKSAEIKATYNAESKGHFTKSVTLKFVDYKQPIILNIEGDVQ